MSGITSHILDTSIGRPAASVEVELEYLSNGSWKPVGQGVTNADGRVRLLPEDRHVATGFYRIRFATGSYFKRRELETFYPEVQVQFEIRDPGQHYHVPLLLNPFGYSTYRGS